MRHSTERSRSSFLHLFSLDPDENQMRHLESNLIEITVKFARRLLCSWHLSRIASWRHLGPLNACWDA